MFNLPGGKILSAAVLACGVALSGCATDGYGGYGSVSVGTGWYDDGYWPGYYGSPYYGRYYPYHYNSGPGYVIVPRHRGRDRKQHRWHRDRAQARPAVPARPPAASNDRSRAERWRSMREPVDRDRASLRDQWRRDRR